MRKLESHWYRPSHDWVTTTLLPFSWVFGSIVKFRRMCYRINLKKSVRFTTPVIVVGNITAGGTGKTPFVIWLAKFLREQGFKPGIVSRGVGGKQKSSPRWVEKNSNPHAVGDEAVLLACRSDCPVVVGIDRVAAVRELLSKTDCNIVISDDGLQHYRMDRSIEIALIDGERGLGNRSYLPAGPLRESPKRLKEVDFVVYQSRAVRSDDNDQRNISEQERNDKRELGNKGKCLSSIDFVMHLQGNMLVSVKDAELKVELNHFQNDTVHAVAAIGNPNRFFAELRAAGLNIIEHVFPDHYLYAASDFNFGDALPIIMTEKDAIKCQRFADERFWCLPVEMQIDDAFAERLLKCLSIN